MKKVFFYIIGTKDSVRRKVILTMAETMSALLVVSNTIWDVDWRCVIGTTLLSGLVTMLIHIKDIK